MPDTQMKVLANIARLFSEEKVLWALGGSTLLYMHKIVEHTDRIKLIITPEGAAAADAILSRIGEKHPRVPSRHYATQFFSEYTIEGQTVFIISGMTLHYKGFLYSYPFGRESIVAMLPLDGIYIPATAIEDWYVLYQMMPNREQRVASIEKHFATHGLMHPERFEALRHQPIPPVVIANIGRFRSLCAR